MSLIQEALKRQQEEAEENNNEPKPSPAAPEASAIAPIPEPPNSPPQTADKKVIPVIEQASPKKNNVMVSLLGVTLLLIVLLGITGAAIYYGLKFSGIIGNEDNQLVSTDAASEPIEEPTEISQPPSTSAEESLPQQSVAVDSPGETATEPQQESVPQPSSVASRVNTTLTTLSSAKTPTPSENNEAASTVDPSQTPSDPVAGSEPMAGADTSAPEPPLEQESQNIQRTDTTPTDPAPAATPSLAQQEKAAPPPPPAPEPVIWPPINVTGVIGAGQQGSAIINNKVYGLNETFNGVTVKDFLRGAVLLEYKGETRQFGVGKRNRR